MTSLLHRTDGPIVLRLLLLLLLAIITSRCHGDSDIANHLVLFDSLPGGISDHKATPFDIRTNFSGTVQLVESRDFRLVVNITAPSLGQAYDVDTRFVIRENGWLMLEVVRGETTVEIFNPTWLLVTLMALSLFVAIFTGAYAIHWYRIERDKQDFSEQKSFVSSSHRGTVERSKNSLHIGALQGDGIRLEDVLRGDDELRQVREMPDEEEAEAFEMEQLKKLKFQDESDGTFGETDDSDPQERNLTKSHQKTLHKELLKKSVGKKGPPPMYRRTQMGKYEGVPTNDTDDTDDDKDKTLPLRHSNSEQIWSSGNDLRVQMQGDNSRSTRSLGGGFSRSHEKESNIHKSENDLKFDSNDSTGQDPKQLVKADIHPGGKPVMVSITPRDNTTNSRPGNIYVPPSELKMGGAKLSTFGQRSAAPASGSSPTTPNNPPPIAPKPLLAPSSGNQQSNSKSSGAAPTGVTHQDVTRNFQDKSWGSPGLLSMSDIPEDPQEDDQSGISGSQKSASMYGSSEIFEVPESGNTYYNLDSDIDIPPLDSDDNLWSDGGLPSPRFWSPKRVGDKGKTNDDIKLIPGALKSPGPNTGRMVVMKPRPNSSIILKSDHSKSPRPKDKSQQEQNIPPPPSYEEISHNSETAFEFPPPPQFLQRQPASHKTSQSSNSKRDKVSSDVLPSNNPNGDYVVIKHEGKEKQHSSRDLKQKTENKEEDVIKANGTARQSGGGGGGGGGKKGFLGPTYMNFTILSTLCVLTLATGVMGLLLTAKDTRVDITIFAPAHFFTNQTRVFFDELKDTEVIGSEDKSVLVYDVAQPFLGRDVWYYSCQKTCSQGCDESREECICRKGYRLNPDGKCVDVNECMEGKAKCDKSAGCYNRKGSYDCICGEDFYGDGKTCRDCELGCPKDHYEEQPCSADRQKICKACTKSCRHGFYLAQSCGANENALCRECQAECTDGMFESRQCTNFNDRVCTNMSTLALCDTSPNIMLEERSRVKSDSIKLKKTPSRNVGFSRYKLLRGTDFFVEVIVRFIDPTPHFLPVNLSQPFDLDLVAPGRLGSYAVQRYCPTPVPDYYIFSYKKHQSLTYKLWDNGSIEACETHVQFGQFLDDDGNKVVGVGGMGKASKSRDTFVCAQPGSLTNNFVMNEDFFHARTKWVDKSKRCQRHSRACEACTTKCGTDIMFGGDKLCAVDKEGKDIGISPRLMTCYNCCLKKNCSNDCKDYHKRRCQPEQCLMGNLLEFSLKPSWDSSQDDKFFCHIQPVENQRLLEMDYTVRHTSAPTPLFSNSVKLYGNDEWRKKGKMTYSDGILDVELDSGLDSIPNFLEGAIQANNNIFKVGSYKENGAKFGSSRVEMDFVFLRPSTPTSVPHMPQAQQDCTNHALDSMHLATKMENPYIQDPNTEAVANGSLPLTVHHKSNTPGVRVKLSKDTPLLRRLSPEVALLKKNSFNGNLYNNGSHWVINMSAKVSKCPGFLRIQIQDPNNATKNLYDTDIVVFCPKKFNVTFALLTFDEVTMYKDIMVVIHDKKTVHHFRLYHMSKLEEKLRRMEPAEDIITSLDETLPYASKQRQPIPSKGFSDGDPNTPDYPIGLPYLIGIAGVIILLLVLAIIGLCFLPGIAETPQVQWYHPLFAIIYMVVQFVYSIIASASVFFVILYIITSPYVKLISQHGQKGGVTSASSRLELLQLQRHLEKELARQDGEVDRYQMQCIGDVKKIVDDMNEMHQVLLKSTADVFERHRLDLLLEEQKVFVRQKLTKELEKFREDYLKASTSILRRIRQDALASYQNIEFNNTWLEGARFLHRAVKLFQAAERQQIQTFLEWTGINTEMSDLEIDLSFSLPSLPRLDEIQAPPLIYKPPMKRDLKEQVAREMIRSIQTHNNWFFPLEDSALGAVTGYKTHKPEEKLSGRKDAQTMLYVFLSLVVLCDLILLCHRMTKAWTIARLILFGFPEYYRERKEDDGGGDEVFESKNTLTPVQSCRDSPWIITVKMFFTQTISTTFLPKMVGAIAACVVLVCILRLSNTYLTVNGLQGLGLYHSANKSVTLQISVTNSRIHSHSAHINSMEYPSFQSLTNAHLSTHKTVFGYYRKQLYGLQNLTAQMYCLHLKAIGIPSNCSKFGSQHNEAEDLAWLQIEALTHACRFQPVMPQMFQRQFQGDSGTSEKQVETLLESLRTIIYYTSHLIIIFLIIIVIKELAFATTWILLQRSGVIRVRIIVEHDQGDISQ